jgi:lipoprotein signal peptidase
MKPQVERTYRWLFWTLVVVGFALDQGSKYLVFSALYNDGHGDYLPLVGGAEEADRVFGLQTAFIDQRDPGTGLLSPLRTWGGDVLPYVNTGALWGKGQNKNLAFLVISLVAAVAIAVWSNKKGATRDLGLVVALGLILAGTLGNLFDRVVFAGVRDFLQWSYLYLFPTFNIADSCLVIGAGLLLWQALVSRPRSIPEASQETAGNGQPAMADAVAVCLSSRPAEPQAGPVNPLKQEARAAEGQGLVSASRRHA